ncbi:MAG: sigma-54-dependent Fis family transcriptional regulator [bacterium]|nr:sigma-54-dependent Fis family transcriptional regulator [bacterium]
MPYEILIVDDERDICDSIAGVLEDEGYQTRQVFDGQEALDAVEENVPSLVVLDIWLGDPQLDGIKVLETLKAQHPALPIVMMSGHGTVETAVTATKLGAYDFVEKPFKADKLILLIQRALEASQLLRENESLKRRQIRDAVDLVGKSQSAEALRALVDRVAPTNSRVLITGPAGAGKEVIATKLHELSPRAQEPFVEVNCATLDQKNSDQALFGKEPEGDQEASIGYLEEANGGTLFLDEVLDLPLETQAKFVKALHSQSFCRLGAEQKEVRVDVRVLASTSRDIQSALAKGAFREDLYYRLNVVPIKVPPLRERQEDVEGLIAYFMDKLSVAYGRRPLKISPEALYVMQQYSWPGNVRQLRNVVEWMLIMYGEKTKVKVVTIEMLPTELSNQNDVQFLGRVSGDNSMLALSLKEARENFERSYIQAQMQISSGNVSKTAERIGMERSALHRKLKALEVEPNRTSQREKTETAV